jgi:hypothetical protein
MRSWTSRSCETAAAIPRSRATCSVKPQRRHSVWTDPARRGRSPSGPADRTPRGHAARAAPTRAGHASLVGGKGPDSAPAPNRRSAGDSCRHRLALRRNHGPPSPRLPAEPRPAALTVSSACLELLAAALARHGDHLPEAGLAAVELPGRRLCVGLAASGAHRLAGKPAHVGPGRPRMRSRPSASGGYTRRPSSTHRNRAADGRGGSARTCSSSHRPRTLLVRAPSNRYQSLECRVGSASAAGLGQHPRQGGPITARMRRPEILRPIGPVFRE